MKTYKEIIRKVEDQIYCDACGKCCTTDNFGTESATLEAIWGYGSKNDGKKYRIDFCEGCFMEIVKFISDKRKTILDCFKYPYDNDPLDGTKYDII